MKIEEAFNIIDGHSDLYMFRNSWETFMWVYESAGKCYLGEDDEEYIPSTEDAMADDWEIEFV